MSEIFPEPIMNLPEAEIPVEGLIAHLAQGESFQILFMRYEKDVTVPEHSHESQWGVVLEGRVDLTINGVIYTYTKGDRYFIPKGVKHAGKTYAGFAGIVFFNQNDRYKAKPL